MMLGYLLYLLMYIQREGGSHKNYSFLNAYFPLCTPVLDEHNINNEVSSKTIIISNDNNHDN